MIKVKLAKGKTVTLFCENCGSKDVKDVGYTAFKCNACGHVEISQIISKLEHGIYHFDDGTTLVRSNIIDLKPYIQPGT